MITVLEVLKRTTDFLAGKGVESARLNAELLIGHALDLPRMQLYLQFERPLTEPELEKIRPLVRRRGAREPLQYIVGETHFRSLRLKVDRRALIPRPETELLVEFAMGACGAEPSRILDLGTGSGAIALELAKGFSGAEVTGVDKSQAALELARENAVIAGLADRVRWVESDWFAAVERGAGFALIVANPPYLSPEETAQTAPEVCNFEPHSALTAADGGLADLRQILSQACDYLSVGGLLALETGINHHGELLTTGRSAGFSRIESRQDLTGRDRYILAWR